MKKVLSFVIVFVMIAVLSACGENTETINGTNGNVEKQADESTQNNSEQNNEEVNKEQENHKQDGDDSSKDINSDGNIDWVLDYLDKDILNLVAERGGNYQDEWVQYEFDGYTISFSTAGEFLTTNYPVDCKKAGISKDTITDINVRVSHDLFDETTATIIRYPNIGVGGINLGMELGENEALVIDKDGYYIEGEINTHYSPDKIVAFSIKSMLEKDLLNGEYAPEFVLEPLDHNVPVKKIDIGMTEEEVISILGKEYIEEVNEDVESGDKYKILKYGGVTLSTLEGNDYYEVEDSKLHIVDYIHITTNKVTGDFEFSVGDNALEVLRYCDENLSPVKNPHGINGDETIFATYKLKEFGGNSVNIRVGFNRYGTIQSIADVKEDTIIQSISIYYPYEM